MMSGSSICESGAQNKAGFVYFGMHGALPVYSLQHSGVEGKLTLLHNAVCQVALALRADPCQRPSPVSICNLCHSLLSSSVYLHTTGSTWGHYGLAPPSTEF